MKWSARVRMRGAILLLSGGSLSGFGGCLPENYFGDLFVRLSTGAADVAVQTLVLTAIDALVPAANETPADAAAE